MAVLVSLISLLIVRLIESKSTVPADVASGILSRYKKEVTPSPVFTNTVAFTPIVGPNYRSSGNSRIVNGISDAVDLTEAADSLIDYLVPPKPNSQPFIQNFQNLAANIGNSEGFFGTASSTDSYQQLPSSSNIRQYQQLAPTSESRPQTEVHFSSLSGFQVPSPDHSATSQSHSFSRSPVTPSSSGAQIQSVTFQTPNLNAPTPTVSTPHPTTQLPFSREAGNQFLRNQFFEQPQQPQQLQSTDGKWELGFEAGEILAPPNDESFGRNVDYDSIRKPEQFSKRPSANHFNTYTSPQVPFVGIEGPSENYEGDLTRSVTSSYQTGFETNSPHHHSNIVWGSQKQQSNNFGPVVSTPASFLPTVSPSTPPEKPEAIHYSNQGLSNSVQYSSHGLGNAVPYSSQGQNNPVPYSSQSIVYNSDSINDQYQNGPLLQQHQQSSFPVATPTTPGANFDSYLVQGSVSDHTLFPIHENVRHFWKKRNVGEEEMPKDENYGINEEPAEGEEGNENEEQNDNYEGVREENEENGDKEETSDAEGGPVYSFVKTDKDGNYKWSVRHPAKK